MSSFSNYLESALLNATLRGIAYVPTTVYAALFSGDPGEAGDGPELSGLGYARQVATFAAPSGGSCANSATVAFGPATSAWTTATHVALFDAVTGGNLLYKKELAAPLLITTGERFLFVAGTLTTTLD